MCRVAESVIRKALQDEKKNWALYEQAMNEAKEKAKIQELKGTAQIVLSLQRVQRSRAAPKRFIEVHMHVVRAKVRMGPYMFVVSCLCRSITRGPLEAALLGPNNQQQAGPVLKRPPQPNAKGLR